MILTESAPQFQGLYSPSVRVSYRKIPWSLEAAKFDVIMIVSLYNLWGISAALLRRACQISKRWEKFKPESRGFDTSWDFAVIRPSVWWIEVQNGECCNHQTKFASFIIYSQQVTVIPKYILDVADAILDAYVHLVASLMSPVASLVTTDRCSNVSMCLRISTKCFLFPGIVPLLYSVGNKTYYYYIPRVINSN